MKKAFNEAVSTIRDGINHAPSAWCHTLLGLASLSAGAYAYTEHPVAGLATAYFIFSSFSNYYYEGRQHREKQTPRP